MNIMGKKLYFYDKDEEFCYSEEVIFDKMRFDGLKEKRVFIAKLEFGADVMFCQYYGEVGEKGNCGRDCEKYIPRNGISGNCKYNRGVYSRNKEITLTIK